MGFLHSSRNIQLITLKLDDGMLQVLSSSLLTVAQLFNTQLLKTTLN
jgi:hypothetical protein